MRPPIFRLFRIVLETSQERYLVQCRKCLYSVEMHGDKPLIGVMQTWEILHPRCLWEIKEELQWPIVGNGKDS
jgi:hypothetical protein